jgi:hypothetical protein
MFPSVSTETKITISSGPSSRLMVGSGHVAPHPDLDIVNSTWPRQKGVKPSLHIVIE